MNKHLLSPEAWAAVARGAGLAGAGAGVACFFALCAGSAAGCRGALAAAVFSVLANVARKYLYPGETPPAPPAGPAPPAAEPAAARPPGEFSRPFALLAAPDRN